MTMENMFLDEEEREYWTEQQERVERIAAEQCSIYVRFSGPEDARLHDIYEKHDEELSDEDICDEVFFRFG